jgi:hypothetical protein
MKICSRWRIAVCLLLALAAVAACGRRTNPQIPDSPRPEQVKDIKAVTRDAVAFLSWPLPSRNVEGRSIDPADIAGFQIFRAELGRDRKKVRYKPHAEIDMRAPGPATVRNNTVSWTDGGLTYGQSYGYRIRALTARGGISQPSEEVRVMPVLPLAAPAGLVATGRDGSTLLSWETVTTWMDGSPTGGFVGYNLYRGPERGRYEETPLNKEPLTSTSYKDTAVANDRTYYYVVRSVDSPVPPWSESLDSAEAAATPKDRTPPAKPAELTVVPGVDRVFLTWNENKERDLAGYNVYRSTQSGKGYKRLADKPLMRTTYSDESVKSGNTYFYAVTAVDKSGNESARTEEKKVYVEKLR